MTTRNTIFKKWKKWFTQLENEFINLAIKQRHFHELQAVIKPYIGKETAAYLGKSMAQGDAAVMLTTIRRLAEPPRPNASKSREIVSLPTLLDDVQANAQLITRTHQRRRYKKAMKHLDERIYITIADRVHDAVAEGNDVLQPASVDRDLVLIKKTLKGIVKLTDKVYAHIERDRRRIPKNFGFDKVDEAIKTLFVILRKYSLCLFGEDIDLGFIDHFSIADDLRKVWPSDTPLPDLTSLLEVDQQ